MKPQTRMFALCLSGLCAAPARAQEAEPAREDAPAVQVIQTQAGPIAVYLESVPASAAQGLAEKVSELTLFYSQRFGPLGDLSPKVAEVADPLEPPDLTAGTLVLSPEELAGGHVEEVLTGKTARLWWGEKVKPGSPEDAWLIEGLARYSIYLYTEGQGQPEARAEMKRLKRSALALMEEVPIRHLGNFAETDPPYARAAAKAALVLHMLRLSIGEDAFFGALRAAVPASGQSLLTRQAFQKEAEARSGQDLRGFFATWVDSTGLPEFKVSYSVYEGKDGARVAGRLQQPLQILQMPVRLKIQQEGGTATEQLVQIAGTATDFELHLPKPPAPRGIALEAEGYLFRSNKDPELLFLAYLDRGEDFLEQADESALAEFDQALRVRPRSSLAYFRIGEFYFLKRDYSAAANAFHEATLKDQDPAWSVAFSQVYLGKIFDLTGQRERALEAYEAARALDEGNWGAAQEAERRLQEPYVRAEDPAPVNGTHLPLPQFGSGQAQGVKPPPRLTKDKEAPK